LEDDTAAELLAIMARVQAHEPNQIPRPEGAGNRETDKQLRYRIA
jgi:hypothetical protein